MSQSSEIIDTDTHRQTVSQKTYLVFLSFPFVSLRGSANAGNIHGLPAVTVTSRARKSFVKREIAGRVARHAQDYNRTNGYNIVRRATLTKRAISISPIEGIFNSLSFSFFFLPLLFFTPSGHVPPRYLRREINIAVSRDFLFFRIVVSLIVGR